MIIPFIDRVAYRHSLKEVPLDVPEQVCITKDNTQLAVDGIIYYQVTDPRLASYGSSDYITAITQLAQTTLRSEIGKMELDKTFESRDEINRQIVSVLDEAGRTWGIKVLRYEIKSLTPPEAILRAMQPQITAEREKRALIAKSEGQRQQEINLADGEQAGGDPEVRGREDRRRSTRRRARPPRSALIAEATAAAVRAVAEAIGHARRHERGEPEGRRALHRGLRQPRQDQQHADRPDEPVRRGERGRLRDDGDGPHAQGRGLTARLHCAGVTMKRRFTRSA